MKCLKRMSAIVASAVMSVSLINAVGFQGNIGYNAIAAESERTGFVTADGTQFKLDGSTFYYAGTNNYYLNFKPKYEVDKVIEDAAEMGLKVIRTWGHLDAGTMTDELDKDGSPIFKDSVDGKGSKEGVYYQYFDAELGKPVVNEGEDGLQKLDYAIYKAEQEGVKLLIDFTNNWEAFGGMAQYVQWAKLAGENVTGHDDFYTNETIKGWYKNYIETMLNHTNVYTGVKYKDDPTVFAWELANEPRCESDPSCEKNTVLHWVEEMSAFVKSIDSNHMLTLGDEGFYNFGYNDFPEGEHKYVYYGSAGMDWASYLEIPELDFSTLHIYCDQWGLTKEQGNFWFKKHGEDSASANKPLIAEEFGWKERDERTDVYNEWFDIFEGNTYDGVEFAGTNYWMLASLTGDGTLYEDYDGYTVYYEGDANGNPTQDTCDAIVAHAERMSSKNNENSVSPKKADFDIINPANITLNATIKMGEITGIEFNSEKLPESGYTIKDNAITISGDVFKDIENGNYKLTVLTSQGSQPSAIIRVYDSNAEQQSRSVIDDFESYESDKEISSEYSVNPSGDPVTVSLDTEHAKNGKYAMKYEYSVESAGYCGVSKNLAGADWTGFDGIKFNIYSDGSGRDTTIQFIDGAGAYWESVQHINEKEGWQEVKIPFSDFNAQSWGTAADKITFENVNQFSVYAGANGNSGKGVWYIDDMGLYADAVMEKPTATPASAEYENDDILFTIIPNGYAMKDITAEKGDFVQGVDYALNGSQLRINNSYLSKLGEGVHNFHIAFDGTDDLILKVTVGNAGTTTEPSTGESTLKGDANEDKKINVADAVLIMQSISNADQYKLSAQGAINADVNNTGDGITSADAQRIQMYEAKLITSFD